MAGKKFYYDDPEGDVLSPETSHPAFVKLCRSEFYYDCIDDFSPFGNDDGAEILSNLEEWYQEKKGKGDIVKWLFRTIDEYGFKYKSEGASKMLEAKELQELEETDPHFISSMDHAIIAAAFGQMKISGHVDKGLKEIALMALQRQLIINEKERDELSMRYKSQLATMTTDLIKAGQDL